MLRKLMKRISGEQKGITGLETAIILIAFVVVAAVFAYTVLSAGLFSTQKSQEAVYSGLESTQATLELKGDVLAIAGTTGGAGTGIMDRLTFTISPVTGGEPIDFTDPSGGSSGVASGTANPTTITILNNAQKVENVYWTHTALGNADGDDLLESGEKFQITIGSTGAAGDLSDAFTTDITANDTFTVQIKTAKGAVLSFERTLPANLDTVNNLH